MGASGVGLGSPHYAKPSFIQLSFCFPSPLCGETGKISLFSHGLLPFRPQQDLNFVPLRYRFTLWSGWEQNYGGHHWKILGVLSTCGVMCESFSCTRSIWPSPSPPLGGIIPPFRWWENQSIMRSKTSNWPGRLLLCNRRRISNLVGPKTEVSLTAVSCDLLELGNTLDS